MMFDRLKNSIYKSRVEANKKAFQVAAVERPAESEHVRRAWDRRDQSIVKTTIRDEGVNIDITI